MEDTQLRDRIMGHYNTGQFLCGGRFVLPRWLEDWDLFIDGVKVASPADLEPEKWHRAEIYRTSDSALFGFRTWIGPRGATGWRETLFALEYEAGSTAQSPTPLSTTTANSQP